jgi:hypothetical protein
MWKRKQASKKSLNRIAIKLTVPDVDGFFIPPVVNKTNKEENQMSVPEGFISTRKTTEHLLHEDIINLTLLDSVIILFKDKTYFNVNEMESIC